MTPNAMDAAIAKVLSAYPEVAAAWLFGSEAHGEARSDSDMDAALLLRDRRQTALQVLPMLGRVAAELEAVAPGRRIDLVLIEGQGPVLQHQVLSQGRRVYEADQDRRGIPSEFTRAFDYRRLQWVMTSHSFRFDDQVMCFSVAGVSARAPDDRRPRFPGSWRTQTREVPVADSRQPTPSSAAVMTRRSR